MCGEHSTVRGILENLPKGDAVTVLDMGASPEPFARGTPRAVDTMVIVAEPYFKALEAAVRLADLSRDLGVPRVGMIANKIRDDEQREAVEQFCAHRQIELWGMVPHSDAFARADMTGSSPLDAADPGSPAMAEIQRLSSFLFPAAPSLV